MSRSTPAYFDYIGTAFKPNEATLIAEESQLETDHRHHHERLSKHQWEFFTSVVIWVQICLAQVAIGTITCTLLTYPVFGVDSIIDAFFRAFIELIFFSYFLFEFQQFDVRLEGLFAEILLAFVLTPYKHGKVYNFLCAIFRFFYYGSAAIAGWVIALAIVFWLNGQQWNLVGYPLDIWSSGAGRYSFWSVFAIIAVSRGLITTIQCLRRYRKMNTDGTGFLMTYKMDLTRERQFTEAIEAAQLYFANFAFLYPLVRSTVDIELVLVAAVLSGGNQTNFGLWIATQVAGIAGGVLTSTIIMKVGQTMTDHVSMLHHESQPQTGKKRNHNGQMYDAVAPQKEG